MSIDRFGFHPTVARWFAATFDAPTEPQAQAWPAIREGRHTLVAAPTGTGKTLAAFLAALDDLIRQGLAAPDGRLPDETEVVYVSPLKALSNDVQRNLQIPLAGISATLEAMELPPVEIRTLVRTGDTPSAERARMVKRPPHVLVTTPESLYILLGSDGGRSMLATARTVIVDEIHAVAGSKRGSHLALSLERLADLVGRGGRELIRIGLSATQRPIEEVARFLVGTGAGAARGGSAVASGGDGAEAAGTAEAAGPEPPVCRIVDVGHRRDLDLGLELPRSPLSSVMSNEVWEEVYDRLAELIGAHETTVVFVNTRRLAERITRHLSDRLGEDAVTSHHGSLSKEKRLDAEQRLKRGELRALVATASLELGIDVGAIDLVCQIGSTRSIATLLQRVGRSGHTLAGRPDGRIFPLSRDELVEAAALVDAVHRGELDRLEIPPAPLDILAQQIVAAVACEEWAEDDLYRLITRAHPYRDLPRAEFDEVVAMLGQGFSTRRGRRGAYLHHDAVNGRLRARRGARLTALTSGGAIPDTADFDVVLEPAGTLIGSVNEDFAVESLPGDVFQLGNASWRILRIERGRVRVEDAQGQPPSIPFWLGEAPGRTAELSAAVARLRAAAGEKMGVISVARQRLAAARAWLTADLGLAPEAAEQLAEYLAASIAALGVLPTQDTLVLERFFDGVGDMHLVLHAPFGSRVNRAWGLALRKRFCRKFNFELQAAATEDAILLSLGPSHSFPLDDVYRFLNSGSVRDLLIQALLDAPMFGVRWRWNASRALALPRFRGGKRVPPPLQRQAAEDLVAVVFPDQLACLETIQGDREVPDHPLVRETLRDCLTEAMDVAALERVLAAMETGRLHLVAKDVTEPSPLAHEILNARPYAFLDDAPLEERRAQAVLTRRWLDPETAADLGALDPQAIARVRVEAHPEAESADELHDALVVHGFLPAEKAEAAGFRPLFDELVADRRAGVVTPAGGGPRLWVAAERLPELMAVHPGAALAPQIAPPRRLAERAWTAGEALVELVRGRLEALGPTIASALAAEAGLGKAAIEAALAALEAEGFVIQGRFTPAAERSGADVEWCERRLLARIHRYTLNRLRQEIEPVSPATFTRFLLAWQRVDPDERGEGIDALAAVLDQLEGFEAAAAAWEADLLPARLKDYDPAWLDALCLSGRYVWCRVSPAARANREESAGDRRTNGRGNGRAAARAPARARFRPAAPEDQAAARSAESARTQVDSREEAEAAQSLPSEDQRLAAAASEPDNEGTATATAGNGRRRPGPVRTTPVALVRREALPQLRRLAGPTDPDRLALSSDALTLYEHLRDRGASFFGDLARGTGLLKTQVEAALGELVAQGLATADSFTGLRALLVPAHRRPSMAPGGRAAKTAAPSLENAGRWSLLTPNEVEEVAVESAERNAGGSASRLDSAQAEALEHAARTLLARYGVVFRRLLDRESLAPPWRDLLRVLRRLEARGEIRGGRFVAGFSGEQYALPEAVGRLRAARRGSIEAAGLRSGRHLQATTPHADAGARTLVSVSGADPLNLVGIVTPGDRLPALAGNRVLFRHGVPVALRESGEVRFLPATDPAREMEPAERWQAEQTLLRRPVPPKLRPYLGRSA